MTENDDDLAALFRPVYDAPNSEFIAALNAVVITKMATITKGRNMPDIPDVSELTREQLISLRARCSSLLRTRHSGGRNGGRPFVPTLCPICHIEQPSAKLARLHCKPAAENILK